MYLHEKVFGGLILIGLVIVVLYAHANVFNRTRSVSDYDKSEITVLGYEKEPGIRGGHESIQLHTESEKVYYIAGTVAEKLDTKAFEHDITEGTTVTVYTETDPKCISVYGLEYNGYCYLDVNYFINEKVSIFDIGVLLFILGVIFLMMWLIYAYRSDKLH